MSSYAMPVPADPVPAPPATVYTVASGDLRPSANLAGWATQRRLEADLTEAITSLG
ncbi:MAG: fucose isomerase, partial [Actinophytocola sp.]|nr:fucose isomerase [Actinophytocola sp.]